MMCGVLNAQRMFLLTTNKNLQHKEGNTHLQRHMPMDTPAQTELLPRGLSDGAVLPYNLKDLVFSHSLAMGMKPW